MYLINMQNPVMTVSNDCLYRLFSHFFFLFWKKKLYRKEQTTHVFHKKNKIKLKELLKKKRKEKLVKSNHKSLSNGIFTTKL